MKGLWALQVATRPALLATFNLAAMTKADAAFSVRAAPCTPCMHDDRAPIYPTPPIDPNVDKEGIGPVGQLERVLRAHRSLRWVGRMGVDMAPAQI